MSFKGKSPLVVALYLPQYYETEYNNNGGKKDILNGWRANARSRCTRDITSRVYHSITITTTCQSKKIFAGR